jgi:hypothetical protein
MTPHPTPWTAEIVTAGERHAAADRGARVRVSQPSTPTALGFGRYPPRFKALPPTYPPSFLAAKADTPSTPPPLVAQKADPPPPPLGL